jgi:hypothetical protein
MLDKVLILGWILLGTVLIIENIVNSSWAFLFLDFTNTWLVVFVSIVIWVATWYWVRWKMSSKEYNDEEFDY